MFMYGSVIREIISLVLFVVAIVTHLKLVDGKKWGSRKDKILEQSLGIVFIVIFVVVWQEYGPDSYRLSMPKWWEWFLMVSVVVWGWRK
jgi:hypothetical protein